MKQRLTILLMLLYAGPALADGPPAPKSSLCPLSDTFKVTAEMKDQIAKGIPQLPKEPTSKTAFSLEDCITIALSNHQRLTSGYNSIAASLARVEAAQAPYYPEVSLNAEYNRSYTATASFRGGNTEFYKVYGTLSQTIYDFGRRGNSLDAARSAVDIEKAALATTRTDVVYTVKEAYYQVLSSREVVKASEEAVTLAEANLNQAKAHFEAGTKARFDVTKAEVDMQDAKISLVKSQYVVEGAMMTLKNRMFIPYGTAIDINQPAPLSPYEENVDKLVAEAVDKRPESKEMEAKIKQTEFQLRSAKSDFFPTLGLNANYGFQDYERGLADTNRNWNVGVALRVPVFEGFITKAKVSENLASLNNFRSQLVTLKQDIGLEVIKNFLAMKDAEARLTITSEKIRMAREQLEIAQGRYEAGVGILLEVTDARVALTTARTENIQTQNEYYINRAKLDKSLGRE
ncbi:MAG: TolC family protein [Nitrospirota bacterium]|nr:TolC family protein [Nitrospirota bacterium]